MPDTLDHLLVPGITRSYDFKSTLKVIPPPVPQRPRRSHGHALLRQLANLGHEAQAVREQRRHLGLPEALGMKVALEVVPAGSVDYFKQLEWKRDGIEVLSSHDAGGSEVVALFVPEGKLSAFEKRIRAYLDKSKDVPSKKEGGVAKPKHASLINAIDSFRKAAFSELWTDEVGPPNDEQVSWFQVWLKDTDHRAKAVRDEFATIAQRFQITVEPGFVRFPGRVVVAVNATRPALEQAFELLDQVAEIRSVSPTAEFFLSNLQPYEQADWVKSLLDRTQITDQSHCPYVTVLDTGANRGHPLLAPLLAESDQHAVDETWDVSDHHGHGSGMAGLSSYGDLTGPLSSGNQVSIDHRLETVKILPPHGKNAPHLYGWVTARAAETVEGAAERLRTFAMMTTCDSPCTGLPSEWSAAIDSMAFGLHVAAEDDQARPRIQRLITLAAGNVQPTEWVDYPRANYGSPVQDPGQAWNALTVGAFTHMTEINAAKWPNYSAIASAGLLSPCSTTSHSWGSAWPFKPDVVAEGGNGSVEKGRPDAIVGPESLRLLTTARDFVNSPFVESGDTSGAAAEVARVCGTLQARYPTYWPETLRGLVVHGASYTPQMRAELPEQPVKQDKISLLRRFGYGRVSVERSLNSAAKRVTLVLQETIKPYEGDGTSFKLGKLNMHALPLPASVLQLHGAAMVNMRVTLSYFIEPNPSRRGWRSKFRYQSHGLRFAVQGSTESADRFMLRINKLTRDELEEAQDSEDAGGVQRSEKITDPDTAHWFLGAQLRNRGSIHSDTWRGTASQLAQKSHIAVFPVGGWWKDCGDNATATQAARYALIATLEVTSDVDIDIYTPIKSAISVPVPLAG